MTLIINSQYMIKKKKVEYDAVLKVYWEKKGKPNYLT